MDYKAVEQKLQSSLSPKRFMHTLGVVEVGIKLGKEYNVNEEKIKIAALLHDCAKNIPNDMKLRLCKEYHIPLDDIMLKNIELSHSFLGAEIAKREYGIKDEDILNAIRYHTTGRKNMSELEKIIYLADYIEPNRIYFEGLEEIRKLAFIDLNKAMIVALKNTISYIKKSSGIIHPLTIETLKSLSFNKED